MSRQERVYSVLLVSSSQKLNEALSASLSSPKYDPVDTVGSLGAANREMAERDYDFILVNSPLPDGDGMRFAIDGSVGKNSVVLFLVRAEFFDDSFDRASEFGVFLLSKPLSRQSLETALNWLTSARERLRSTEKKVLSFEEKMEEIRLVNRAKWILIDKKKMAEPEAHRYIEKQAMDRCVPKRAVAEEIIRLYG